MGKYMKNCVHCIRWACDRPLFLPHVALFVYCSCLALMRLQLVIFRICVKIFKKILMMGVGLGMSASKSSYTGSRWWGGFCTDEANSLVLQTDG